MEKYFSIQKLILGLIILLTLGFGAFFMFDVDVLPGVKAESSELEGLFQKMAILKVPHAVEPVEIRLEDPNGMHVNLSDFRSKIVFLNFWTTWCPTCRAEMPSMEKLHRKFKDKDFAMVTVNLQESSSEVKDFFKEFKLSFTSLLDSTGEFSSGLGIYAVPTTFLLDRDGRIIGKAVGAREWDSKAAIALFQGLIDKK